MGFVYFLEPRFGFGIVGVFVRVQLAGQLAEGLFYLVGGGGFLDAEGFVIVFVFHLMNLLFSVDAFP